MVVTTETAEAGFFDCFLRACNSSGILRTKKISLEIMLSGPFLGLVVVEAHKSMEFYRLVIALILYKGFLKV